MDYIDIIEKSIYNIDSKICGIIDDYRVLQEPQKVADYVIQFLRTYLEHIAARIYAYENPNEQVPIRGKDKWYTQYMKQLKESNEYGYIWRMHHSLQISTSHYVPAEDGAIRLMDGYLPQLYHLRDQMRDKFGLLLLSNFEDYPQEKSCELDSYYEKIYIALKAIDLEDSKEHTNDRYYITRKKYRTVNGKGFFEYTLSYAQEEITKFDRFVAYSFNDIPDNYSIQCDFYQSNIDFNGVGIDIKCLIAWNVAIRPCELEKLARICGYDIVVKSDNLYYKALMKFLSRTGMNLLDILLADNEEYEIYIQQIELSKKTELKDTLDKIREVIIKEKPGSNILRYITAYLKNDVIRDQLADRTNNLLSYLYLKNEAIPFDEMPYASSLCGHNLSKLRLHKCLEIYDCECQYVSSMVNKEAYDSNILYVIVDHDKLDYYQYEVGIFNNNLYNSKKQQLRKIDSWKKYDLVILDECSTVCNEDVLNLFEKCNAEAYLLIGDIYQIEAIKFGNWFNFARYFVDKKSVYELVTPYRAKDKSILLDMWTCVRNFDENMFERLLANGFISTLNESIFERDDDEIVLCLGYDGLYGVNNINRYMQKINPSKPIEWGNWTYKVGDKVLFNESRRFGNVLYNNLKGSILSIDKKTDEIVFQILVDKIISERDVLFSDIKLIDCDCEGKSIVEFSVKRRVERDSDSDYSEQIVPFQIAYAVSIHKAQGLEYKSVKVVITEDIDEKISHNIFYTAITRTTDKLKIYMSKETQKKLAEKFVKSNVGLKQAQLFAGQAGLKLKNKLSS